jgi:beta-lactamase superfamily II metal-dependent hydrolase
MPGEMVVTIFDVEHGACAMITHNQSTKLAMIDSGHNATDRWYPSQHIKNELRRDTLDYLFITNADQDHLDDLNELWEEDIKVKVITRSRGISAADLRKIKMETAGKTGLGEDIERYLQILQSYNSPVTEPFDDHMGGVTFKSFYNAYPCEKTTNNLSMAVFFNFAGFKILFPGDLERSGWLGLMQRADFRRELDATTVLVASHHGRSSGYVEEVFQQSELHRVWQPACVVMSDKSLEHDTQKSMAQKYANRCSDEGVHTKGGHQRWVLTTRDNGWIQFRVKSGDCYSVHLERDHA